MKNQLKIQQEWKITMIRLVATTRDNWQEALNLKVREQQEYFVPSVAVSLAKVHIRPDGDENEYLPFCLYSNDDLVGFVMVAFDVTTNWCYWMNGFMIDEGHQGKGYGMMALKAVVDFIRERFPHSICLNLTVNADNTVARYLYKKYGFTETGDIYDDEVVYRLDFLNEMKPTIYVISGPAGVGKSTTSKKLVESLPRSSYISGDDISHIPVNGRGKPWLCQETLMLIWENIASLARNLVSRNYDVVIDYVTFPTDVENLTNRLSDLNVRIKYVVLVTDVETLTVRDKSRPLEFQMGERSVVLLEEFINSGIDSKYLINTSKRRQEELENLIIEIKADPKYLVIS